MAAIKIHTDYAGTADCAGTTDYAETGEWAQLDFQSIQHRDYFGHLSILIRAIPSLNSHANCLHYVRD